jgi:hypothetical protein
MSNENKAETIGKIIGTVVGLACVILQTWAAILIIQNY